MIKQKQTVGGKREGAGRPKGEKKKALGIRVPERLHAQLTDLIRKQLNSLK